MRILHTLRAPVGGLFRHVLDLARAQAALGHDVGLVCDTTTLTATAAGQLGALSTALGVHTIPMGRTPGLADASAISAVTRIAYEIHPDIVHGHGAKGGAYARLGGRILKARGKPVRVFYTPHGGSLNTPPDTLAGRIYTRAEKIMNPLTDGLIFESAFAARVFESRVGSGTTVARVIHNGLQPSDFAPTSPVADPADFVFVGELRPIKGVDTLLRALRVLNEGRTRKARAVIVGSGPDRDLLIALANELALADNVTFPGPMAAREAFRLGRCVVVPSRKESLPYIVLEAAAAGMPLVLTNVGGIAEITLGTDTPLIDADDVSGLVEALRAMDADPGLAQDRASRLRASVANRFSVERMTSDVLAFYRQA